MGITQGQIDSLKARMKDMSDADLSILAALSESFKDEETVRLVTIPGSKNDLLWSEMAALNLMTLDKPLEEHAASRVYMVKREAGEPIAALLKDLKGEQLPDLFNRLRQEIPPLIAQPVIAADGTPSDVAMMLAGIVEATMYRWIKPEAHEEFLKAVLDRAQDLSGARKR